MRGQRREASLVALIETLKVLEPYLDQIVIVGGWVPFLYHSYGRMPSQNPLVRTMDIDVAVPRTLPERGSLTVNDLLTEAGYRVRLYGSDSTIVKYELPTSGAEVEFLTAEVGQTGKPTLQVQRGLSAQKLRYVGILLENTVTIQVREVIDRTPVQLAVKLPSPAAYVYQKGLTLRLRGEKVAKDLYYIFDFVDSSPEVRQSIVSGIAGMRTHYPRAWFVRLLTNLRFYFIEGTAPGVHLVSTQYEGKMAEALFQNYVSRTFRDFIEDLDKPARG